MSILLDALDLCPFRDILTSPKWCTASVIPVSSELALKVGNLAAFIIILYSSPCMNLSISVGWNVAGTTEAASIVKDWSTT